MNAEDVLKQEIANLRAQIKIRESALHALQDGKAKAGDPSLRFYNMRPLDAARILLRENGNRLGRKDLEAALVAGGITIGKKRGLHNIRISLDTNVEIGNLKEQEGVLSDPLPSKDPPGASTGTSIT